ncbi:hypothetical protein HOLleu_23753 [Holothuria leucospilota]|uniref:Uncharacterized protein n=1 Tax=Holothuria leucospilota TaxID=206669 RepID=A0A9Q1H5S6_HOLLE|nr:hypothetical protein HOLleu_23753 [Holothuria leucospilota]
MITSNSRKKSLCEDNLIAFLDYVISVNSDGTLTTQVYQKPTHTDHFLQFDSHHPLTQVWSYKNPSIQGDKVISKPELIDEEEDHIREALGSCG